jgi:hypothetical protein
MQSISFPLFQLKPRRIIQLLSLSCVCVATKIQQIDYYRLSGGIIRWLIPLSERGNNWSPVDYCGTMSVRSEGEAIGPLHRLLCQVCHSGHPSKWEGSTQVCADFTPAIAHLSLSLYPLSADFTYCRSATTPVHLQRLKLGNKKFQQVVLSSNAPIRVFPFPDCDSIQFLYEAPAASPIVTAHRKKKNEKVLAPSY